MYVYAVDTCVCACEGQRSTPGIFLILSPSYFLSQGLTEPGGLLSQCPGWPMSYRHLLEVSASLAPRRSQLYFLSFLYCLVLHGFLVSSFMLPNLPPKNNWKINECQFFKFFIYHEEIFFFKYLAVILDGLKPWLWVRLRLILMWFFFLI